MCVLYKSLEFRSDDRTINRYTITDYISFSSLKVMYWRIRLVSLPLTAASILWSRGGPWNREKEGIFICPLFLCLPLQHPKRLIWPKINTNLKEMNNPSGRLNSVYSKDNYLAFKWSHISTIFTGFDAIHWWVHTFKPMTG